MTDNAASMWGIRNLSDGITCLPIIQKDLCVTSYASKMVARWRIANVLDELRMGLDRLYQTSLTACFAPKLGNDDRPYHIYTVPL